MQEFQDIPDGATLERIVREVLAALGAEAGGSDGTARDRAPESAPATPRAAGAVPAAPQARIVSSREGELAIPERVVTATLLEDRLHGMRRLLVRPGAILTPSARDLLRQRQIVVTYGPVPTPGGATGWAGAEAVAEAAADVLPIVLVTRRISAAQLSGLFRGEGLRIAPEEMDCMVRASQRAAEAVRRPGGRAVVVTSLTAAGVCLANRLGGVRAVAGRRPNEVALDAAAVGANVLVADARQGVFQIKRMIMEFVRSPRRCPEAFAPHLS